MRPNLVQLILHTFATNFEAVLLSQFIYHLQHVQSQVDNRVNVEP